MAHLERDESGVMVREPDMQEETCEECTRIVPEEDVAHTWDDRLVCAWCRPDVLDTFECDNCGEFKYLGIPARCPKCDSFRIEHTHVDTQRLIEQRQWEHIQQCQAQPLESMRIMAELRAREFPFTPAA